MKTKDRDIRELPLNKLRPHPANAMLYPKRSRQEIDDLATDLAKHGQTEPVEVTPDGIIISGHTRWLAAQQLGWPTLKCWVRHDLAEAGAHAIELRLIEANLCKRRMSRLDVARSFQRLKSLARGKGKYDATRKVRGDVRDLLAERFGLSGRSLDRWLQVLELPLPVQVAFDDGKLPLTLAVKVDALEAEVQATIARRIQAGENAKQVVKEFVAETTRSHCNAVTELDRFLNNINRGRVALIARIEEIRPEVLVKRKEKLEKAQATISQLLERAKA
jgi:ParB-like chromosome segregation protein Spo0J